MPPPIDTARFRRADPRPASGEGRLRVQYVGNIAGERFPAALVIDALRALRTADRAACARSACTLPVAFRPDNAEWASSMPDAEELEIDVNLEDLTEARKAELYSSADVMLYPYLRPVAVEPPLTLLEAMACEAVPVGTASANRSGVIVDGENGFIYDGTEQLTAQLARFAALGPRERARLGEAARRSIVERFGRAATATQLERLWGELAERRRPVCASAPSDLAEWERHVVEVLENEWLGMLERVGRAWCQRALQQRLLHVGRLLDRLAAAVGECEAECGVCRAQRAPLVGE